MYQWKQTQEQIMTKKVMWVKWSSPEFRKLNYLRMHVSFIRLKWRRWRGDTYSHSAHFASSKSVEQSQITIFQFSPNLYWSCNVCFGLLPPIPRMRRGLVSESRVLTNNVNIQSASSKTFFKSNNIGIWRWW